VLPNFGGVGIHSGGGGFVGGPLEPDPGPYVPPEPPSFWSYVGGIAALGLTVTGAGLAAEGLADAAAGIAALFSGTAAGGGTVGIVGETLEVAEVAYATAKFG